MEAALAEMSIDDSVKDLDDDVDFSVDKCVFSFDSGKFPTTYFVSQMKKMSSSPTLRAPTKRLKTKVPQGNRKL